MHPGQLVRIAVDVGLTQHQPLIAKVVEVLQCGSTKVQFDTFTWWFDEAALELIHIGGE